MDELSTEKVTEGPDGNGKVREIENKQTNELEDTGKNEGERELNVLRSIHLNSFVSAQASCRSSSDDRLLGYDGGQINDRGALQ